MSQENVEVVRQVVEVWNESGWKGCKEAGLLDPEIEELIDAGEDRV